MYVSGNKRMGRLGGRGRGRVKRCVGVGVWLWMCEGGEHFPGYM